MSETGATDEFGPTSVSSIEEIPAIADAMGAAAEKRVQLTQGLRELADFLDANPDLYFPTHISWSVNDSTKDDAFCIARIEAWRAAGFVDKWDSSVTGGHHSATIKFAGFEAKLSFIERAEVRPWSRGKVAGESDESYQKRVDEALAAAAAVQS